jgi:hypothetical protein
MTKFRLNMKLIYKLQTYIIYIVPNMDRGLNVGYYTDCYLQVS